ncbi:MAG: response regulator [Gammaproteobacteria bacterium]|nr:response regulator [Gammaproteobacteria bacterium]
MKRILVIDDEPGVRDAFSDALDDMAQVDTAASGEEGLAKADEATPDLIFLDLKMPGIDGVETLRRLQQSAAGVPVFIVTAFHREFMDRLQEAAQAGLLFNVLDKPLDSDQIRVIARSVFEGPQAFEQ